MSARINPIIVKELRSRMRGARAFAVLTSMLLLLGLVSYLLYRIVVTTSAYSATPLSPQIGQTLFIGLAFLELMVVCFVTPAVTAGAISGEREKLTYEMLLATPLRPASILWGKLISALSYVLLLIFAAIPMASLVFIFGGVAPRDMLKALVILVAVSVTLGVIGIFMSTWLGRTGRATVLSYLAVLALLVGPPFAYVFVGVLRQAEPPRWILVPNPVSALFSALTPAAPGDASSGMLWGLGMAMGGNLAMLTGQWQAGLPRPLYHYTLPLYAALTLVLYFLASRFIQPTRRWRLAWKEALVGLAAFLLLGGLVALAFLATASRYENAPFTPTPAPGMPPVAMKAAVAVARPIPPPPPPPPTEAGRLEDRPAPAPPFGPGKDGSMEDGREEEQATPPATSQPRPANLPIFQSSSLPSAEDQAAIYAAVVRQLYTVDHTFGGQPPNFPTVYLVQVTDDGVGDPEAPRGDPQALSESLQAAIVAHLEDLPAEFVWVATAGSASEVPRDSNAQAVAGGGAIITLGNIHGRNDGSSLVSASLFFSMLGATGKTYVLERVDDVWEVTGDTGVQWVS